ncbi:cytochrome P450 4F6-like [Mya arenaria]|uniref:cytochrome P450 4F6-like n=1 Tax=Mya arenaria TaxID=6604 RepID=UPI0022E91A4A|nr:cytochrome P450 4F6-like [Mya arenaria]
MDLTFNSALITSLLGCVILFCYGAISFYLYVRRVEKAFEGFRTPPYHWLFGSLVKFPKEPEKRLYHYYKICNEYEQDGVVFLWGLFRRPLVVVCTPESMAKICKSNAPKAQGLLSARHLFKQWLGEGLVLANGERWARNRRLLTPAFHFDILKGYTDVFNRAADVLVAKLRGKAAKKERVEMYETLSLCTLEIILKCAFSCDKDIQKSGDPYEETVNRMTPSVFYRIVHPYLLFDFLFRITKVGQQFKKDCDFLHSVAEEIIDKRQKALDEGVKVGVDGKRYVDFLDILLTARDEEGVGLSRLEIRQEVDTFLSGGHETTASTALWVLYSLAGNPDYQLKCQQEVDQVLEGRDSDVIKWSDLPKFEFLTQCIKEAMRLHGPVPIASRDVEVGFELGGRKLPEGTIVQLNIVALHHKESVWGLDHMEFKPERFSPENISKMSPFQFVPFSAGSRNCIGQHFAMNEEKVLLAKMLRNFTFRLDPTHVVKKTYSNVMRPADGMFVYAEERNVRTGEE